MIGRKPEYLYEIVSEFRMVIWIVSEPSFIY